MKTLIVGANGKVGTLLSGKMWAAHDFSPVALIRDPPADRFPPGCPSLW